MAKIAPSLITGDFCEIGSLVRKLDQAGADWIHLDIMDGVYVPNMTFGHNMVRDVNKITDKFLDTHLMVHDPNPYLETYVKAGADMLTVHVESPGCTHVSRTLQSIRALGCQAGVALNPATSETTLEYIYENLDLILVMSVNPGFGGQSFIPQSLRKIERISNRIQQLGLNIEIEVDGGVNLQNVRTIKDAGATVFVTGHAVVDAPDMAEAIRQFHLA